MVARFAPLLCLIAALALVLPTARPTAQPLPVDLELVLAVDISGSIDDDESRLQREGYLAALIHPSVIEAVGSGPFGRVAITYIEWAGDDFQQTVVDWMLVEDEASARTFVATLAETPRRTERWTSISTAIDFAVPMFDGNAYEGTRRVIDVSGDGYNNRGRQVTVARDDAVGAGITINGLPIINHRPSPGGGWPAATKLDEYYEKNVIGGPGAFIVVAEGFEDFARAILSKLVLEIAGLTPDEAGDLPYDVARLLPEDAR